MAEAEGLKVEDGDIDAKVKEVKKQLAGQGDIDPQRLRDAVIDDLLREKLLGWLEDNSTVTERHRRLTTPSPRKSLRRKRLPPKKAVRPRPKAPKPRPTSRAKTPRPDQAP